jgi:hypothetical protein
MSGRELPAGGPDGAGHAEALEGWARLLEAQRALLRAGNASALAALGDEAEAALARAAATAPVVATPRILAARRAAEGAARALATALAEAREGARVELDGIDARRRASYAPSGTGRQRAAPSLVDITG